jgi:hypothetical protein
MRKISLRPASRRSSHAKPCTDRGAGHLAQARAGESPRESSRVAMVLGTHSIAKVEDRWAAVGETPARDAPVGALAGRSS